MKQSISAHAVFFVTMMVMMKVVVMVMVLLFLCFCAFFFVFFLIFFLPYSFFSLLLLAFWFLSDLIYLGVDSPQPC